MRKRLALLPLLGACALACAYPQSAARTPDTRPSLAFQGAPAGTVLYLDGNAIGDPNAYDGEPNVLLVEPGTHVVTIRAKDGTVLFERKIFVESERKTVQVH